MVFLFILGISILTAIGQLITSSYDLKNPAKKGIAKITIPGWIFYICTGALMFMPAILNECQNRVDEEKEEKRVVAQELKDVKLRISYDSALIEMKKKFDTTTIIISETLAKYGYKLDTTNKELISIKDSVRLIPGEIPVLTLMTSQGESEPSITLLDIAPDNKYKFKIHIQSRNASSSFFDIKYDFVVVDSNSSMGYFIESDADSPLDYNTKLSTNDMMASYHIMKIDIDKPSALYVWVHGNFKKADGSGDFSINEVYGYYFKNKRVMLIKGLTRENVLATINQGKKN